jgi:hypothetical protein
VELHGGKDAIDERLLGLGDSLRSLSSSKFVQYLLRCRARYFAETNQSLGRLLNMNKCNDYKGHSIYSKKEKGKGDLFIVILVSS